jgi:hypothetical protein
LRKKNFLLTCHHVRTGVGIRHIEIRVCQKSFTFPLGFSFQPPTIETAFGTQSGTSNQQLLLIRGANFGPNRVFDGVLDYIKINGSYDCAIKSS